LNQNMDLCSAFFFSLEETLTRSLAFPYSRWCRLLQNSTLSHLQMLRLRMSMPPQHMMGKKSLSRLLLYKKRLQFVSSSLTYVFHFSDPCFGLQVQHDHSMDTSAIDIATVDLVVNALHYIFPTFDYRYNKSMGATVLCLLPCSLFFNILP
jgi:hypothetical protein